MKERGRGPLGYAITGDEEGVQDTIHHEPRKTRDLEGNLEGCHEGHIGHQEKGGTIPVQSSVKSQERTLGR